MEKKLHEKAIRGLLFKGKNQGARKRGMAVGAPLAKIMREQIMMTAGVATGSRGSGSR
jgi:hypothetical protein